MRVYAQMIPACGRSVKQYKNDDVYGYIVFGMFCVTSHCILPRDGCSTSRYHPHFLGQKKGKEQKGKSFLASSVQSSKALLEATADRFPLCHVGQTAACLLTLVESGEANIQFSGLYGRRIERRMWVQGGLRPSSVSQEIILSLKLFPNCLGSMHKRPECVKCGYILNY